MFFPAVNASYELDFWGKYRDATKAGLLNEQVSRFDKDVVALATIASVVTNYLTMLAAGDLLRIAQQDVDIAETVLKAEKERLSAGTANGLDVAQEESVVASQRASLPPLEQQLRQSRNILVVLTGRTPESASIKGGGLDALHSPPLRVGIPSQLVLRRPDIAEAEAKLASAKASVDQARAAFFPDIQLTGQAGLESLVLKNLLTPQAIAASLVADVTQPIFSGYQLEGRLALSKAQYEESLQNYRKTIIQALADVENALIAVHESAEHERLQRMAVAAARKAYDGAIQQLHEGTIDITTVLNTQRNLFQAETLLVQVRLQYLQAFVTLYQALGGGWTSENLPVKLGHLPDADGILGFSQ